MLEKIEQNLRSHPFVTPSFLQNTHVQTLLQKHFPSFQTKLPSPKRNYITMPDGTKLAADCFMQEDQTEHTTIVVLDGLGNSGMSPFSQRLLAKAFFSGFNVINLFARGTGDTVHLTKDLFDIGIDNDTIFALEEIVRWRIKNIFVVGYSAGGYYALLSVTKANKALQKHIKGVVAICVTINAYDYIKHLERNPFYHWILLRIYKDLVKRRLAFDHPDRWDRKKLKSVKTIMQFRYAFLHNLGYPEKFSSLEDYYKKSDLKPLLKNITVPTLIINTYDDPIAPIEAFLSDDVKNNPNIITLLPKHGGHGGFFTTKRLYGDLDGHWAQNRAMEFIKLLDEVA